MKFKGGYFNKILHVDLNQNAGSVIEIDDAFCEKYVGGRGFGAKLLWERVMKNGKVDPLGPGRTGGRQNGRHGHQGD